MKDFIFRLIFRIVFTYVVGRMRRQKNPGLGAILVQVLWVLFPIIRIALRKTLTNPKRRSILFKYLLKYT